MNTKLRKALQEEMRRVANREELKEIPRQDIAKDLRIIGLRLKKAREMKGKIQLEVAMSIGVCTAAVACTENGTYNGRKCLLIAQIARYLNLGIDDIYPETRPHPYSAQYKSNPSSS